MSTSTTEEGKVEGGRQRWPRRRVLGWALGLVPLAAGGGWAAYEWLEERARKPKYEVAWSNPHYEAALWACYAGDPKAASLVGIVFDWPEPNALCRLLRACLFMEAGEWTQARTNLAFPGLRDSPEGRLLLALAERRPRAPDWRHAFFEVWQSLGKPDFRNSTLLPPPLESNLVIADIRAAMKPQAGERRFAMGVLDTDTLSYPYQEGVLENVHARTSVPLLMALYMQLLALHELLPLRKQLLSPVVERLGQLAGPAPTLQLGLVSFLAGSAFTAPFSRGDLEALEKLVALPEWKQPSSESFFREMRTLLDGLLPAPGHHAWVMTSLAQGVFLGSWLLQRARASKAHLNEDEQRWLGRLLWDAGARLREQRSDRELDMGLRLQKNGAELMQHPQGWEQSIAAWMELGRWEDAVKQAALYRWPLASLQEACCEPRARDELVWMKAFAGANALP
ncbi:hypothetical protein [Archangium sp.]|uniref:hypothetical protein n=1 Tax=Archangium sp. TaxID=1872627 RepID=UPI00389A95DE